MGTKNNPPKFDCLAKAEPDEPYFVLLGRDPSASLLVEQWARIRELLGESGEQITEAHTCAYQLAQWCANKGKAGKLLKANDALEKLWRRLLAGDEVSLLVGQRFEVGQRVQTLPLFSLQGLARMRGYDITNYADTIFAMRTVGKGFVEAVHDSHGLCYDVRDDETRCLAIYEPDEVLQLTDG